MATRKLNKIIKHILKKKTEELGTLGEQIQAQIELLKEKEDDKHIPKDNVL